MPINQELLLGKIVNGFALKTLSSDPDYTIDSVSPFYVFDEDTDITISSTPAVLVNTDAQHLSSFLCSAFGEIDVSGILWFDFSADPAWPSTICLLNTSCTRILSGALNGIGVSQGEWILLANSSDLNYSSFCELLESQKNEFPGKFRDLPPKIGVNYNGSVSLTESKFASVLHILPGSLSDLATSIQYSPAQTGGETASFDIEILCGNLTKGPITLEQFIIGLSINEGSGISDSDIILSLKGKLATEQVSLDFGGHYPLNGSTDISLFGSLTASTSESIITNFPTGLPGLQFEGDAAISFNNAFEITSYEFGAKLENIPDLIPDSIGSIGLLPVITAAGLGVSGENFQTPPEVVLDFSTRLFDWLQIRTSLLYPEQILKARLEPSREVYQLGVLLNKFGWTSPPQALSDFVLKDLELTADLLARDFSFKIEIGSDYSFGDLFTLNDLFVYFHYRGAMETLTPQYDLFIEGTFDIDGIDFLASISFARDTDGSSRTLNAEHTSETVIPVGTFIQKLCAALPGSSIQIPDAIAGFTINTIGIEFTKDAQTTIVFKLYGALPINGKEISIVVDLTANKGAAASTWSFHFAGAVGYAGYAFELQFDKEKGTALLASFKNANNNIEVGDFLRQHAPDDLKDFIPEFSIGFQDAFIGFYKAAATPANPAAPTTPGKYSIILGLDVKLGAGLDFAKMPVVGDILKEQHLDINNLRIVGCIGDLPEAGLTAVNSLLSAVPIRLLEHPKADAAATPAGTATTGKTAGIGSFKQGIYLSANIQIPGFDKGIPVHAEFTKKDSTPVQAAAAGTGTETNDAETVPKAAGNITPPSVLVAAKPKTGITPVGKQLGPFFLESIALGMDGGKVKLEFTGGFSAGPVSMQVMGFSVSSPLTAFEPEFDLKGLSLGLDKPPLTISGALLKNFYATKAAPIQDVREYSGAISIGFKQFSLAALGAYAEVTEGTNRFKSLFIYGFLGAPIGGPAFFFVTGLAAGVGYNRRLNLPKVDGIGTFPLIAIAKDPPGTAPSAKDLEELLTNLKTGDFIPPTLDAYWFAIGLRVESFKMINSFVLLAVQFGHELEIDILGISTMRFPLDPNAKPLAKIIIGLKARILPARGIIDIRGEFLPGTYILDENAKLSGGFAMLGIMKNQTEGEWNGGREGEFIITLGGYGPWYKPKPYYPQVPRLELNWKVSDVLNIHADAYFAITPEAMMVGGHMLLDFYSGGDFSVSVHIVLGVDFIIYWQPVHYLANAHAELRVTATINELFIHETVSFDMGADLVLWGPPFAGYADVHVHFLVSFSFTVEFGGGEIKPAPLTWDQFRSALLPDKILAITLQEGQVTNAEGQKQGADELVTTQANVEVQKKGPAELVSLNAKQAKFSVSTAIPVKVADINDELQPGENPVFGIKSMGLTAGDISKCSLSVTIDFDGRTLSGLLDHFDVNPIRKNMPAAMWQPSTASGNTEGEPGVDLISDLLCGFEFCAKPFKPPNSFVVKASDVSDKLTGKTANWRTGSPISELFSGQTLSCPSELDAIFN